MFRFSGTFPQSSLAASAIAPSNFSSSSFLQPNHPTSGWLERAITAPLFLFLSVKKNLFGFNEHTLFENVVTISVIENHFSKKFTFLILEIFKHGLYLLAFLYNFLCVKSSFLRDFQNN